MIIIHIQSCNVQNKTGERREEREVLPLLISDNDKILMISYQQIYSNVELKQKHYPPPTQALERVVEISVDFVFS